MVGWHFTPPSIILLFATALSLAVMGVTWRRRSKPGGRELAFMMLAVAIWTCGAGLEVAAESALLKTRFVQFEYLGYCSAPVFFLLFVCRHTRQWENHLSGWRLTALWVVPAVSILLAWTNGWHGLIWNFPGGMSILGHGPWFWVVVAYAYMMTFAGLAALVRAGIKARGAYRWQLGFFQLGVLFPLVTGTLQILKWTPYPEIDLSSIGFAATGVIFAWDLVELRLLDHAPVAHDILVENMPDGLVVLDEQWKLLGANPAASRILTLGSPAASGNEPPALFQQHPELQRIQQGARQFDTTLRTAVCGERHYSVWTTPLPRKRWHAPGWMVVLHDITEIKRAAAEQDRLIGELKAALNEVKTLSGLLPICAHCKKIRDDKGYWTHLENYIQERSSAQFSHGICPECAQRHYAHVLNGLQKRNAEGQPANVTPSDNAAPPEGCKT